VIPPLLCLILHAHCYAPRTCDLTYGLVIHTDLCTIWLIVTRLNFCISDSSWLASDQLLWLTITLFHYDSFWVRLLVYIVHNKQNLSSKLELVNLTCVSHIDPCAWPLANFLTLSQTFATWNIVWLCWLIIDNLWTHDPDHPSGSESPDVLSVLKRLNTVAYITQAYSSMCNPPWHHYNLHYRILVRPRYPLDL